MDKQLENEAAIKPYLFTLLFYKYYGKLILKVNIRLIQITTTTIFGMYSFKGDSPTDFGVGVILLQNLSTELCQII